MKFSSRQILADVRKRKKKLNRYGCDVTASRRFLLDCAGSAGAQILEVGTGKGHLAVEAAKRRLHMVSIDSDPEQLAYSLAYLKALGRRKFIRLKKMNAEKLRYARHAFDTVVSIDFFHHARSPLKCLREMMRVTHRTLAIADLNQTGLSMMRKIHRLDGRVHHEPLIPFLRLKKELQKTFHVKTYRKYCRTYFIARRKETL